MNKGGGKIFLFLSLMVLSGFFYTQKAVASVPMVVINEICWMGGVESANDESIVP